MMLEIIALTPETMARIREITGEPIHELESKFINALAQNEVVMYNIQTWTQRRPHVKDQ